MKIEFLFQLLTAVFLIAAGYFYWGQDNDLAFFSLVLSACSFFLNIRFRAKARLAANERSAPEKSPSDL